MGMFDFITSAGKRTQMCLFIREDDRIERLPLEVKDRFIIRKIGQKVIAWPYLPSLRLPLTFKGKYLGEHYLVCERTGEPFDPHNLLSDDWKGKKLMSKINDLANEEHHKQVNRKQETVMDKATVPMAWAVGIFIFIIGMVVLLKNLGAMYGG